MFGLSVDEGADDVAESRQRQVDLSGLLEAVTRGARLGLALTARQVHEHDLAVLGVLEGTSLHAALQHDFDG